MNLCWVVRVIPVVFPPVPVAVSETFVRMVVAVVVLRLVVTVTVVVVTVAVVPRVCLNWCARQGECGQEGEKRCFHHLISVVDCVLLIVLKIFVVHMSVSDVES